jgi:MOSC domain-containing protein YiiM
VTAKPPPSPALAGRVASLHLHPKVAGEPFSSAEAIEVVKGKGIVGNPRYFDRPTRRQVTLIEREQIGEHAATLGVERIDPGAVRSNIETSGVNLIALIGRRVQIGGAVLLLYDPRQPCAKMDAVVPGLRDLMKDSRQGVLAQVVKSGTICVGDEIQAED